MKIRKRLVTKLVRLKSRDKKPKPWLKESWGVQNATVFAEALALSLVALSTLVGLILWQRLEKSKNEEIVQFPLRRIERDVIR